jgi:hypothetical protein
MEQKMMKDMVEIGAIAGSLMNQGVIHPLDAEQLFLMTKHVAEGFKLKAETIHAIEHRVVYEHALTIFAHKEFLDEYGIDIPFHPVKEFQNTEDKKTFYYYADQEKMQITVEGKNVTSIAPVFKRIISDSIDEKGYKAEEMLYNEGYLVVKAFKK